MKKLRLQYLDGSFAIHRFEPNQVLPAELFQSTFYNVTRTTDELSVVCDAKLRLPGGKTEEGWTCFKVLGPLDFALTGILAKLATTLAEVGVSIFAISTFDTDYVLHKTASKERALRALESAGYDILASPGKP